MANRTFAPLAGALERGTVLLYGTVNIHSDSSVLTTGTFKGGTFAKPAGTGVYTLTLSDKYQAEYVWIQPLRSTAADYTVVLTSISADVVTFTNLTGGSAADPTSCTYYVLVLAKNSVV